MTDVSKMSLTDVCIELKQIKRAQDNGIAIRGARGDRRKALEDRYDFLMDEEVNGIRIVNPEALEEGRG